VESRFIPMLEQLWLWIIAVPMAFITSLLVKRAIYAKSRPDIALVLYLLVTMASMFGGGVIYLLSPSIASIVEALGFNAILMIGGAIVLLHNWTERSLDEEIQRIAVSNSQEGSTETSAQSVQSARAYPLSVSLRVSAISLILLNEFLMGWAFVLASGSSTSIDISTFSRVVGSDWFIFTMVLEMIFSVYMLRRDLPRSFFIIVLAQSVVMFFAPTALSNSSWVTLSIYLGSISMIGLLIFLYEYLFKTRIITNTVRVYFLGLLGIYAAMMAGLFVWIMQGNALLFVLSIIGEMVLYFGLILSKNSIETSKSKSWLSDPWWVFGFMTLTFVAEYFMGALIDVEYNGISFISNIPVVSISGSILNQIAAVFYNFIVYFGSITGSPWFLIMMGAEMGALVVFKIIITRELETKIRLVLVVAAYFIYSIFLPSFVFSNVASIPFLGWSMGIGTAGAVAPVFLGAILGTYLITGILSFLFGARQTCSVFCTAALMYQGTFPDAMSSFNRTSKLGKKLLTSRMSNLYKIVVTMVVSSIIIAAVASYLNSIGVISFSFFGTDIAYFLYIFYFNFLWYIIFISIPFVGTYGCVTTGYCHIGLFNQFVSRLGIFRLKVKDPMQCVNCETKDCAKACPVGLTDLPGSFIKSGQFRSHKCIGVGDCVSACPYENEYFYDVRGWLRQKLGIGSSGAQFRPHLPVIGSSGTGVSVFQPGDNGRRRANSSSS
jgi:polyferredoxin